MKLYHLKRFEDNVGWDEIAEAVVRAKSPRTARKLVAAEERPCAKNEWVDPKYSTCRVVRTDGPAEVVLSQTMDG